MKRGKKYLDAAKSIDRAAQYDTEEAIALVKKSATAKLQCAPMDEPVYQFMNKKRSEGKPYRVYMMASANKFLRIYYASVKAYLDSLEHD